MWWSRLRTLDVVPALGCRCSDVYFFELVQLQQLQVDTHLVEAEGNIMKNALHSL